MPDKEFLESYALYRKFKVDLEEEADNIPMPRINLYCKNCKSMQTFVLTDKKDRFGLTLTRIARSNALTEFPVEVPIDNPSSGEILNIIYTCVGCGKSKQSYSIKIGEDRDYVMKVGQYPPWEISVDKNLKKILREHEETYKKGLTCESQGYGIAAYAYYRRIVEEIIDELLESITDLISVEDKEKYIKALEEAKKSHNAQDKIAIVKDFLPPILMPEGNNPLKLLYSQLSGGIHSLSDEECLEKASYIRNILLFLVKEIINRRNSSKEFTDSLKGLLSKSK